MKYSDDSLKGQVAFITGAGRGIGKELSMAYAQAKAAVVCISRTEREIKETAKEINDAGGRAIDIVCDVTDLSSVKNAYKIAVKRFGGIDIVLVNAGVNIVRDLIGEDDPEGWVKTIDVNLIGAYYCIRESIPYLKKRGGGKIISIGSGRGRSASTRGSAYACSKAGLWMLIRVVAEELREYDILVNELIPGPVLSDMNNKFKGEKLDNVFTDGIEWVKEPKDVVPMAMFLATLPKKGPTGQTFSLNRREI